MTIEKAINILKNTAFLVCKNEPDRVDRAIDTVEKYVNDHESPNRKPVDTSVAEKIQIREKLKNDN